MAKIKDALLEQQQLENEELDAEYQRTHCSHPKYTEESIKLGQCVHCRGSVKSSPFKKQYRFMDDAREDLLTMRRNNPRWDD